MIRIMIAREENGVSELYTAGGSNMNAFWEDTTKMMQSANVVSYHTESPEELLLKIAHKLEKRMEGYHDDAWSYVNAGN